MGTDDYAAVFKQALKAGEERDYPKAIKLLSWLVASTDRFPHALLYLGRSYHAVGEPAKAVPVFEFYLKLDPESGPGHFFLGRTQLALGQYQKAVENLRYVSEENPEFLPALSLLGLSYLKLRKADTAIACFRKALELDPRDQRVFNGYLNALLVRSIRLVHREEHEEAEENLQFILKHRTDSIVPHVYLARVYREQGKNDLALKHYEAAAVLSPKDPVFPLLQAVVLLQKGDAESALKELEKVQRFTKDIPTTHDPTVLLKFLSITLFQQQRFRDALRFGKQVLKANYRDVDVHGIFAESYFQLQEFEKARNHFQRCIDVEKGRKEFHYGLALALWELADYQALMAATRRLQRLDPRDELAHYFQTLCSVEFRKPPEETIPRVQELIRKMGPDVQLMYALAKEYMRTGMPELAEGWLIRTLKLDAGHQSAYLSLCRVYRAMEKADQERDILERYLERFPQDNKRKRDLVRILIHLEEYEKAGSEIVSLLSRFPRSKALKKNLARCTMKAEKYHEAAVMYRELLKDEPDSLSYLRSLTYCLEKIGNGAEAIHLLELAADYFSGSAAVLLPLGVLYFKSRRYEDAKEIFRKITAEHPRDWRAYQNLAVVYKATGQVELAEKFLDAAQRHQPKES